MIFILSAAILIGFLGAFAISRSGADLGLIDTPTGRSSHTQPTPKGGGIGILLAFILASLFLHLSPFIALPVTTASLIALYGDIREIHPGIRLFIYLAAAGSTAAFFLQPVSLHGFALLLFWTVFITGTANFYNFMDGINGIAGITGAAGFGLLALLIPDQATVQLPLICAALSAASLGFLPLNIPRAKVFMGDVGSILLGLLFGIIVMHASSNLTDFLCYAALLFPFYADELSTMALRIANGDNLTQPHRKHIYQLLANECRIAHWKVSCLYGVLQLLIGTLTFMIRPGGLLPVFCFLLFCSALSVIAAIIIRRRVAVFYAKYSS